MKTDLEELRKHFRSLKITQKVIAEKMGVTPAYINAIFTGKTELGKKNAEKLQELFGISSAWLLTGEGNMIIGNASMEGNQIAVAGRDAINNNNHPQTIEELVSIIKKDQEQRDRLIAIIEKLTNK